MVFSPQQLKRQGLQFHPASWCACYTCFTLEGVPAACTLLCKKPPSLVHLNASSGLPVHFKPPLQDLLSLLCHFGSQGVGKFPSYFALLLPSVTDDEEKPATCTAFSQGTGIIPSMRCLWMHHTCAVQFQFDKTHAACTVHHDLLDSTGQVKHISKYCNMTM